MLCLLFFVLFPLFLFSLIKLPDIVFDEHLLHVPVDVYLTIMFLIISTNMMYIFLMKSASRRWYTTLENRVKSSIGKT